MNLISEWLNLFNAAKDCECCWFERSRAHIVLGITLKSAKQIEEESGYPSSCASGCPSSCASGCPSSS